MINKDNLKRYSELKNQEKMIKSELELLNPIIKDELIKSGADKIESEYGAFTLKYISVWKYSNKVENALNEVEKLKANEKASGVATSETRHDLVFKNKKEE